MVATDFVFLGGRPSLDLVATLGRRHTAAPVERVPDPETFGRWLVGAGVLPGPPPVTTQHLADARTLREAINVLARPSMAGSPATADALAVLDSAAQRPDLPPRLHPRAGAWTTVPAAVRHPAAAALATVARDAVRLLGGPSAARIKECDHPDCSILFLDDTQSGRRRWCSMERCGNLVKIAGYRRRRTGSR